MAKAIKASAPETAGEEGPGLLWGCPPTVGDGHLKGGAPGLLSVGAHPAVGCFHLEKAQGPKGLMETSELGELSAYHSAHYKISQHKQKILVWGNAENNHLHTHTCTQTPAVGQTSHIFA